MAQPHAVEVLLRPAVELYTVAVCAGAAVVCVVAPWALALNPVLGLGSALAFLAFGAVRLRDAWANRAKAGQVIGNFNNLFMLRVRETATAELLTRQLPKVEVYTTTLVSGATDSSDIHGPTDFTSNAQDRISTSSVPLIEPAHVVGLPKGQCFALIEGGNLWKVRMPLPAPDPDEAMPRDLQQLAGYMRQHYAEAGEWWEGNGQPPLHDDDALPANLAEDVQEGTPDEEAPS